MTIERAYIQQKVDAYHYLVRIPAFNKSNAAIGATTVDELYTATVCVSAGITPAYNPGCAVYVAFEANDYSAPVILGLLFNDNAKKVESDISTKSLVVSTNVELPEDTQIGEITPENIKTLKNQTANISEQFIKVESDISKNSEKILNAETNISSLKHSLGITNRNLDNHKKDTTSHITAKEREKWNNHTHTKFDGITLSNVSLYNVKTFVLTSSLYGEQLPQTGEEGQLFFRLES